MTAFTDVLQGVTTVASRAKKINSETIDGRGNKLLWNFAETADAFPHNELLASNATTELTLVARSASISFESRADGSNATTLSAKFSDGGLG